MTTSLLMLALSHTATAQTWALAFLITSAFSALTGVAAVSLRFGRPTFSARLLKAKIAEGIVFAVSSSTTSLYNDLDKAMLSHFGLASATGIYAFAYRMVDICTTPIRSIHSAALPRFFEYGAGGISRTAPFAAKILSRTWLLGAAAAAAMFVSAPLVPKVLGPGFAQSASAIRWLCLIPLLRSFHLSSGDSMSGAGYQGYRLASQCFAVLINVVLNCYLIPAFSWRGAAWASLTTDGMLGAVNWAMVWWLTHRDNLSLPGRTPLIAERAELASS
jgi:O-antigen/teichoic acid export membrane protein